MGSVPLGGVVGPMNTAWIFDVDGTLTPSRKTMDGSFREWFLSFQEKNDVYLVTGSDRPKTVEQVGSKVFDASRIVFNCCGNEAWIRDRLLYRNEWSGTPELIEALEEELEKASFRLRTGQHIELRTGLINFSVVGRGADHAQRAEYVSYDSTRFERRSIAARLKERFKHVDFAIAGETGIDIYPIGKDKSQTLMHIKADRTVFFGDAIWPGGNDQPLAVRCDEYHHVSSWEETRDKLMEIT
jgi:phosphomannomutase